MCIRDRDVGVRLDARGEQQPRELGAGVLRQRGREQHLVPVPGGDDERALGEGGQETGD